MLMQNCDDSATTRVQRCLSRVEKALQEDLCDTLLLSHQHEHGMSSKERSLLLVTASSKLEDDSDDAENDFEDYTEGEMCSISFELKHLNQLEETVREELQQAERAWHSHLPKSIASKHRNSCFGNCSELNLDFSTSCDDTETAPITDTDESSVWSVASSYRFANTAKEFEDRHEQVVTCNIHARLASAVHETAHGGQFSLAKASDLMLAQLYQQHLLHNTFIGTSNPKVATSPFVSGPLEPLKYMRCISTSLLSNWLCKHFQSMQMQQMRYYGTGQIQYRWIGSTPLLGSAAQNGEVVLLTGGGENDCSECNHDRAVHGDAQSFLKSHQNRSIDRFDFELEEID